MPEFKSDEWHEVVHTLDILQVLLQRHVADTEPVLRTRKIRHHVDAIADELAALYQACGVKMNKAAEREAARV